MFPCPALFTLAVDLHLTLSIRLPFAFVSIFPNVLLIISDPAFTPFLLRSSLPYHLDYSTNPSLARSYCFRIKLVVR